jgi:hypothetical protein
MTKQMYNQRYRDKHPRPIRRCLWCGLFVQNGNFCNEEHKKYRYQVVKKMHNDRRY